MWKDRLSEHQIRGWIAIYAEDLQGKGSHRRSVFFTDTGSDDECATNVL